MPERNVEFGKFGARGARGSDLVARRLDELAGGIATPITVQRGLMARLRYLTRTGHARQAAKDAGLTVTDRTLKAWLDGRRSPSKKNLERIDAAYRRVRRQNVARHLLGRLNRQGRGTRVEFHPLNQSGVARPHQRVVEFRSMNVRRWDRIVESWAAGDHASLDTAWTDGILPDLGSQWGAYEYCTSVGFAA
ncbi:transcriptional regulator [Streptomyces sp. TRM66268-LWL]|uniref:Transcriptional regulator n=1 Tax=Streptomyces polyasparticus TaxID=2767826 RepID=A0ABR7SL55_9ACTN|nr:transcriptional regulator [Streptomyces polyasparticus]MBC9715742.1 transcriptional regulator [Streptomyces polyasparticus]